MTIPSPHRNHTNNHHIIPSPPHSCSNMTVSVPLVSPCRSTMLIVTVLLSLLSISLAQFTLDPCTSDADCRSPRSCMLAHLAAPKPCPSSGTATCVCAPQSVPSCTNSSSCMVGERCSRVLAIDMTVCISCTSQILLNVPVDAPSSCKVAQEEEDDDDEVVETPSIAPMVTEQVLTVQQTPMVTPYQQEDEEEEEKETKNTMSSPDVSIPPSMYSGPDDIAEPQYSSSPMDSDNEKNHDMQHTTSPDDEMDDIDDKAHDGVDDEASDHNNSPLVLKPGRAIPIPPEATVTPVSSPEYLDMAPHPTTDDHGFDHSHGHDDDDDKDKDDADAPQPSDSIIETNPATPGDLESPPAAPTFQKPNPTKTPRVVTTPSASVLPVPSMYSEEEEEEEEEGSTVEKTEQPRNFDDMSESFGIPSLSPSVTSIPSPSSLPSTSAQPSTFDTSTTSTGTTTEDPMTTDTTQASSSPMIDSDSANSESDDVEDDDDMTMSSSYTPDVTMPSASPVSSGLSAPGVVGTDSDSDESSNPSTEPEDEVCIDATALSHLPTSSLVYGATHRRASVLCNSDDSCATPGHMVKMNNQVMSMRKYCAQTTGGCVRRVRDVNSPKYQRGLTVMSKTEGLVYTVHAARFASNWEEHVLRWVMKMGF